jgi:hypothetical protein
MFFQQIFCSLQALAGRRTPGAPRRPQTTHGAHIPLSYPVCLPTSRLGALADCKHNCRPAAVSWQKEAGVC